MIDIVKLLLPLLTFFMGVAFTLWTKRGDQKRMLTQGAAVELIDAVTSWHQRIYDLRATALKQDQDDFRNRMIDYDQNRHELPRIIRSLEILRADQRATELVRLGDDFLSTFTVRDACSLACSFCYLPTHVQKERAQALPAPSNALVKYTAHHPGEIAGAPDEHFAYEVLPEYLTRSDAILQQMSLEVGRLQAA